MERAAARASSARTTSSHVPDWFKADYFNYYPTLDQIKTQFKPVDWDAYNASAEGVAGLLRPEDRAVG